ncbi:hypothetical protein [Symmachiella dynata]|uniref:hypothetical protein n=1 Tax=Symmachiella dynata TaxID=2527995 RepID=UPI0030ED7994|tara:strand:+ start:1339 stop:1572 length:234 start_codon:yes stop_codon:yes gene_type:complete
MNTTKHSTSVQPFNVSLVDGLQHVAQKLDDDDEHVFADVVRQGAEAIAAFANIHNEEGGRGGDIPDLGGGADLGEES